jgi:hypothetical protein
MGNAVKIAMNNMKMNAPSGYSSEALATLEVHDHYKHNESEDYDLSEITLIIFQADNSLINCLAFHYFNFIKHVYALRYVVPLQYIATTAIQ